MQCNILQILCHTSTCIFYINADVCRCQVSKLCLLYCWCSFLINVKWCCCCSSPRSLSLSLSLCISLYVCLPVSASLPSICLCQCLSLSVCLFLSPSLVSLSPFVFLSCLFQYASAISISLSPTCIN